VLGTNGFSTPVLDPGQRTSMEIPLLANSDSVTECLIESVSRT
jgi:hypothetical protein